LQGQGDSSHAEPKFIPGLELSELYHNNVVAPILNARLPSLRYSAGLIGTGSEVLGYDTPQSMDHNWGLRLFIFLSERDLKANRRLIEKELGNKLPLKFLGYPTSFGEPDEIGVRLPDISRRRKGRVRHYVVLLTIGGFMREHLGLQDYKRIKLREWLGLSQQKLLEVTRGRIFRDDLGIKTILQHFRYYPRDIWLYLMASQWQKIAEEEAFVARTSAVGDELGSRIISSRIAQELMELCFLMERRYAPYSKWFGKAFSELETARELKPILARVLESESVTERERCMSKGYQIVAAKHNSLHITDPISTRVSRYYGRPYMVIHGERFAGELRRRIESKEIRKLSLTESMK